jgi:asparagine synthase (glutamine-hydrolysing)
MCGIAGFQGGFEEGGHLLQRMSAAVWHRGPDDQGHWSDRDAGVGLCQRRLSIIDLSPAGHQPMLSDDGNIVLVYNGELYNHPELRAELESSGAIFRGHSDTETILRLFERDGKSCLGRLNGIFALAIWDRQRRSLLLARDPMGVKPLYYVADSRGLLFGSELKSLLQDPEVSARLFASGCTANSSP